MSWRPRFFVRKEAERLSRQLEAGAGLVGPEFAALTPAEATFLRRAKARGLTHGRSGWPDFLMRRETGELFGVEVKSGNDEIRESQRAMFEMLEPILPVFVWWDGMPGKLIAWRSFEETRRRVGCQHEDVSACK